MIRAKLRLARQLIAAAMLLVLVVCGGEVGVRLYEVVQGRPVCPATQPDCPADPSQLAIPSWLTHLELKPHARADVESRDLKHSVEVRTNSLGFRGPEVALPEPADTFRIVILGDETTYAPETSDDDHFVRHLADLLQHRTRLRIEVINASIPGACPLTEFLVFKHKLLSVQPDLVVLHFDWSDVTDDRNLRRRTRSDAHGTPLSCTHAALQESSRQPHPIDQLRQQFRLIDWGLAAAGNQWKQRLDDQAAASREPGTNAYAWLRQDHPESDVAVQQSFRPIADLSRLSPGSSFQLVIATSPKPWQVSARCTNGAGVRLKAGVASDAYYPSRAPFEALHRFASSLNLRYVDLSGALLNTDHPEANYLRYAPRWSADGHRRVAEYLAGFLVSQVPGPWNSPYFQRPVSPSTPRNEIHQASGVK